MENIFLIGFMGTGKSTVASWLSREYDMDVIEMDERIAEKEGISIPEIFKKYGETYFRDAETGVLQEIAGEKNKVISCGGGVVLRESNVALMKQNGRIIFLTATPETILERVKDSDNRPLLQNHKNLVSIREMMEQRREKYEKAADLIIDTDKKAIQEICLEILGNVGD